MYTLRSDSSELIIRPMFPPAPTHLIMSLYQNTYACAIVISAYGHNIITTCMYSFTQTTTSAGYENLEQEPPCNDSDEEV